MNDKTWDRVSGLLIGAAAGFIAGILLAPSKGTDTRDVIKKKTQGTIDQVSESVRDIRDNLTKKGQELWRRGSNRNSGQRRNPHRRRACRRPPTRLTQQVKGEIR